MNGLPERMRAVDMKTSLISDTFSQIGTSLKGDTEVRSLSLPMGSVDIAVSPLGRKQGLNWQTVVAVPRADFMSSINQGFLQSVVIAIACIIFALTVGLTIVERVIRDIRKLTAAAEQQFVRIGQRGPVIERETNSVGGSRNGHDTVGWPLGGAIPDDEEVVVVVDQFIGGRQALAQGFAYRTDQRRVPGVELLDKAVQLLLRCQSDPQYSAV